MGVDAEGMAGDCVAFYVMGMFRSGVLTFPGSVARY